jgi:hypothetical protein
MFLMLEATVEERNTAVKVGSREWFRSRGQHPHDGQYFRKQYPNLEEVSGIHGCTAAFFKERGIRSFLDAGCSWAFLVHHARNLGLRAYGFDASWYVLNRTAAPGCVWWQDIAAPWPLLTGSVEWVNCFGVLEHLGSEESAELAMLEMRRVARVGVLLQICFEYREMERHVHTLLRPREWWARTWQGWKDVAREFYGQVYEQATPLQQDELFVWVRDTHESRAMVAKW